ncbi:MAG: DUF2785 domain-containing protein [Defluviitaleaceae bacterium]|nr:DUF2785 domain-containing protein [Defluviitaleaceae bacterium]
MEKVINFYKFYDIAGDDHINPALAQILENMSSVNPNTRSAIYKNFENMVKQDIIKPPELIRILDICLSEDYLYKNLGAISDDVFARSSASLIISTILEANAGRRFLSIPILDATCDRILEYITLENDTRGFVEGKGWAHAIAHAADMLQSLVSNTQIPTDKYPDVLGVIQNCLFKDATYIDQEDERLVTVVKTMMQKGLESAVLERWVLLLHSKIHNIYQDAGGFTYTYHRANVNVCNFLKSLYFSFKTDGERLKLRVFIFDNIKQLQKAYQ